MTLSRLAVYGILSYMVLRRKAHLAAAMYILTILCTLGMASLDGGEQSVTRQWIEEGINTVAQVAFALRGYLLYSRFATVWEYGNTYTAE